jgi:bifunctional non-homologous end joining protein LigD
MSESCTSNEDQNHQRSRSKRDKNYRSEASRIHFFVFDLLVYQSRDVTPLPLVERRSILRSALHFNSGRVRITDYIEASANDVLHAIRQQGLEGLIGKRKDSR